MAQLPVEAKRPTGPFRKQLVDLAQSVPAEEAWMRWPHQHELKAGTLNVYRWRINRGEMWGPGFEAAMRKGVLWCRHVGK